jgi:molybdopterin converting factor small subunit
MPPASTSTVPAISVRVLLFARYAELFGRDALELSLPAASTLADAVAAVRALPGGERLPERPLAAVNRRQAGAEAPLGDGDEVALLPPLAGG